MDAEKLKQLAEQAGQLPGAAPVIEDPEMALHVDGDYAAYYYSGKEGTTIAESKANMLSAFAVVKHLVGAGAQTVIHLTGQLSDKGQRYKIATVKPYQGQREEDKHPQNWEALRYWLENEISKLGFRVVIWNDREADDGAAASARYAWQTGKRIALFSRDKDFRMMPGEHVVWTTYDVVKFTPDTWELRGPDGEVYGQKWFWLQMLMGDNADHIPGLEMQPAKPAKDGTPKWKTCGEACAEARLVDTKNATEAYAIVKGLYEAYYGASWTDRFVEQAALLWMRTGKTADVGDFIKGLPFIESGIQQALQRLHRRLR